MPLASRSHSLTSLIAGLDDGHRRALEMVRRLALKANLPVFLVGGPVRDFLLGTPVVDLDFCIEGDAVDFGKRLASETGGSVTAHSRFGTATVLFDGTRLDLVTARCETYSRPGQLPEVSWSSISDDLRRRDFTVNAMALPIAPTEGSLLDPLGGLDDLRTGFIRILHSRSFEDDPTRMFRALRYEQRFGFQIEDSTMECLVSAISASHMNAVSGDRWRHEIERILEESDPGHILLRASEVGLLPALHPALSKNDGLKAFSDSAGEDFHPDEWLAALFDPLTVDEGESVIGRLRLSGQRAELARDTIALRELEPRIRSASGRPAELFRLLSGFHPAAVAYKTKVSRDQIVASGLRRYLLELQFTRPVLTGGQLLEIGVPQGPVVGEILTQLRDARLDGIVSGEEEERALVRELLDRNLERAAK